MSEHDKIMLPAMMPLLTMWTDGTEVKYFPSGIFGEWHDFPSLKEALTFIGDKMVLFKASERKTTSL